MCTIVSISKAVFDAAPQVWTHRIIRDSESNPHGVAALLARANGEYTSLRTQDVDTLVSVLTGSAWTRVWVHSRWGTGGGNTLENTHGFCSGGVWYMHNGFIRQAPASSMPVDSMAIGKWISEGTVYDKLFQESYANVFLVAPHSGVWTAVRAGPGGQLHTDGHGNFSTVATADVSQPVLPGTKLSFKCPQHRPQRWVAPSATTPWVGRASQPVVVRGSTATVEDLDRPILPSRQPIPAPATVTPRVFANVGEYWDAVSANEIEFDMDEYRALARSMYE